MPSAFPFSPVIRECSWKETQVEKKISIKCLTDLDKFNNKINIEILLLTIFYSVLLRVLKDFGRPHFD